VTRGSEAEIRELRAMAQRAIIADYDDARGHMLAGVVESWMRQPLRSEALLLRAIELNPSLVLAHAQLGSTLSLRGAPAEGLSHLDFAIRLSPNDQQLFFMSGERALAHWMLGNWDAAIRDADTAITRRRAYWYAHVIKINALVSAVRHGEAQGALAELREACPKFAPDWLTWVPFIERDWTKRLAQGLNRAGGSSD
jgi:tetratricopeptide (TPR) repeat protein